MKPSISNGNNLPITLTMCRYRDDRFNRALAPEGETLSFAPPKESIQRKGGPVAAYFLRSSLSTGVDERGSCPFVNVRHPRRKLRYSARHTGLNSYHRLIFFASTRRFLRWFPSSSLVTQLTKLQLRETGSWSFPHRIPKLELGN